MPHKLNLIGKKFNRLLVKNECLKRTNAGKVKWHCLCDCGNYVDVIGSKLVNGVTQSCGCFHKEVVANNGKNCTTHGMSNTPEFSTWRNIKKRCYCVNNISYKNYGGRGIKVCEEWLHSFETFYKDMGKRPSNKHSIERIDNMDDYTPENCLWATHKEQGNNRRDNVIITFQNKTQTMTQWAEEIGISKETLWNRINNLSWSIEKSLTEPLRPY